MIQTNDNDDDDDDDDDKINNNNNDSVYGAVTVAQSLRGSVPVSSDKRRTAPSGCRLSD